MKLYSRTLIIFYFATSMVLISIGALSELVRKYYPITKRAIFSFAKEKYGLLSKNSNKGLLVA